MRVLCLATICGLLLGTLAGCVTFDEDPAIADPKAATSIPARATAPETSLAKPTAKSSRMIERLETRCRELAIESPTTDRMERIARTRKDYDVARWGQFTDIKDNKEEMLRRVDVHFENWLNA